LRFGFFSDWFILLGGFKPTFDSFFEAGLMCKFGIITTGGFLLGWICTERRCVVNLDFDEDCLIRGFFSCL